MKKVLTLCLFLVGFGATAQQRPHQKRVEHHAHRQFTPEQQAILQSKKMTLNLSLDENQQEKVESLLTEHFTQRKELRAKRNKEGNNGDSKSSEERFNEMSGRLDRKIAFQREMKEILTQSQFEQWQGKRSRKKHPQRSRHRR